MYGVLNQGIPTPVKIERSNLKSAITQVLLKNDNEVKIATDETCAEKWNDNSNKDPAAIALKLESPDRPVPLN